MYSFRCFFTCITLPSSDGKFMCIRYFCLYPMAAKRFMITTIFLESFKLQKEAATCLYPYVKYMSVSKTAILLSEGVTIITFARLLIFFILRRNVTFKQHFFSYFSPFYMSLFISVNTWDFQQPFSILI